MLGASCDVQARWRHLEPLCPAVGVENLVMPHAARKALTAGAMAKQPVRNTWMNVCNSAPKGTTGTLKLQVVCRGGEVSHRCSVSVVINSCQITQVLSPNGPHLPPWVEPIWLVTAVAVMLSRGNTEKSASQATETHERRQTPKRAES